MEDNSSACCNALWRLICSLYCLLKSVAGSDFLEWVHAISENGEYLDL